MKPSAGKTPAAIAAEELLDAVGLLERIAATDRRLGIEGANGVLRAAKRWADATRAQATLDACEQAEPRVRAEGVADGLRMARDHARVLDKDMTGCGDSLSPWDEGYRRGCVAIASWCEQAAAKGET